MKDLTCLFLKKNKNKPGVKQTASGLQYQVLNKAKGAKPKPTDTVSVEYEGRLLDGSIFDATTSDNPIDLPVNGVIKGWQEALQLMHVGSKLELYIPSELAYGSFGTAGIPANATLIFIIKLCAIKKD